MAASPWWPCHSPSKVGTQVRCAWSLWWNEPSWPLASEVDLIVNLTTAKARGRLVPQMLYTRRGLHECAAAVIGPRPKWHDVSYSAAVGVTADPLRMLQNRRE